MDANAKRRAKYHEDGGKRRRYNQQWKDKNREVVRRRETAAARVRAGTGEGYRRLWLANCKRRAAEKGLPFDLTLDDLGFPDFCPVLGIPLLARSGKFHDNSPSIDRTIPEKGYVKGNVVIMSYRANRIKCHASLADLEAIVAYMRGVVT